ncbi:hypothetical protein C8R48DRAFT_818647 [Suillus tomentosus]|nr:hypothetical protein C8R48DRAFT_818647 [Suillus tomentosus]
MGKHNHIPELLGMENYVGWATKMQYALACEDLWCHINTKAEPGDLLRQPSVMPTPVDPVNPTAAEIMAMNRVASIGLVKDWLMGHIKEAREEVQTDQQLISSYWLEVNAKLKQVAELEDPMHAKVPARPRNRMPTLRTPTWNQIRKNHKIKHELFLADARQGGAKYNSMSTDVYCSVTRVWKKLQSNAHTSQATSHWMRDKASLDELLLHSKTCNARPTNLHSMFEQVLQFCKSPNRGLDQQFGPPYCPNLEPDFGQPHIGLDCAG